VPAIPHEHRQRLAGYRMPPEWAPHLATYLVWPHNADTWLGRIDPAIREFARMAAAIAEFEPVRILTMTAAEAEDARRMIRHASRRDLSDRVESVEIVTDDSWIRDYGPIFLNRGAPAAGAVSPIALDWIFNSWGGKYGPWKLDDAVPRRLAERYRFEVIEPGIVLEGGSIDVNGSGSALTTESCLLNPNRNRVLGRKEVEEYLRVYLGIHNVIWLGEGIAGDDTDGHIDELARFTDRHTVVAMVERDPADLNYNSLQDNLRRLRAAHDELGRPLRVETLAMPPALFHEGQRLPASYANFYLVNGGVLVPAFGAETDAEAVATLERLFPERRVVSVPCTDLVLGLGAIHCLTMQHPAP
jgi:agmatine deiminase